MTQRTGLEDPVAEAVAEVAALLRADGADLVLADVDRSKARVVVRVELGDVTCLECVLAPDELAGVVTAAMARRFPEELEVIVDDPRRTAGDAARSLQPAESFAGTGAVSAPSRHEGGVGGFAHEHGRMMIRRPTAVPRVIEGAPSYVLDQPIAGVRVGLRHEGAWRSWIFIVGEWERFLREDGARPIVLQTGERVGSHGTETRSGLEGWVASVDCAISGLGTCGSCTSWSVHDAIDVERSGKPAIVAVTEEFETHGRNMATHLGHPDLKILVFPYPLEARPEEELRPIALAWYPKFLDMLGAKR